MFAACSLELCDVFSREFFLTPKKVLGAKILDHFENNGMNRTYPYDYMEVPKERNWRRESCLDDANKLKSKKKGVTISESAFN